MEFHSIPLFNPVTNASKEADEFFRKSFLSSELVRDFYNLDREEKEEDSDDYEGFFEDLKLADEFFGGKKEKIKKQPKKSRANTKKATQKKSWLLTVSCFFKGLFGSSFAKDRLEI